jgi:4,5-dihydroxyphthalate decarboxylase
MSSADKIRLRTVLGSRSNTQSLKDGTVKPRTFEFAFEDVDLITAFRRMVRRSEFDVCEMAITTYLCAKAYGKALTAVPVFPVRAFHHGAIHVNTNAVRTPKDLEGKKVGVNRGYTVTSGVWARGILQKEHSVDLSKITWVLSGDDHVAEYRPPKNVVPIAPGKKIEDMLAVGQLAAAIGVQFCSPDVKSLVPNPVEAGLDALTRTGHYPINHLVVFKSELAAEYPDLATDLFDVFARAKHGYIEQLKSGDIARPDETDVIAARVMAITGDPMPYGIAPNLQAIDELVAHAYDQGIIDKSVSAEDLFAPSTHYLIG